MNSQENRDRLAREVKVARLRKFKTVDSARIAAKVSRGTWDSVEKGDSVKEFSLASIEEALDWPPGYALALLEGHDENTGRGPGRLAELIEKHAPNSTDAAMAEVVGVNESTFQRWRSQAVSELPESEVMHGLAALLKIDVKDVLYAAGVDAGVIIEAGARGHLDLAAGMESGRIAARVDDQH